MAVNFVMFFATFAFGFVSSIVHGWALAKMWGWFIVPTFTNLPAITTLQAVGVQMVVSLFFSATLAYLISIKTAITGKDTRPFREKMLEALGFSVSGMLGSVIVVGLGWIWYTYIM
jgi:hypothetical protein